MKKFCLTCGEQILLPTRSDKKFCCAKCYRKYYFGGSYYEK